MRKQSRSVRVLLCLAALLALVAGACASDDVGDAAIASTGDAAAADSACFADPSLDAVEAPSGDLAGTTITLATHDSFFVSEGTLKAFTDETGIIVEQVAAGDAGQLVSAAVLTADNPTADVMFGIDNSFLCRGLEADLFMPYEAASLGDVHAELRVDPHNRVTPIDFGDVCVNYWVDALPGSAPASLDDLTGADFTDQFVTMNPETSSPGFAFLLATIAKYGEDSWEDYWSNLVDNGLEVTSGWSDAYYGSFTAGGGNRSVVTSYASSPPAEYLYADPPVDAPPTEVLFDSCFRQIEFAGILAGTEHPEAAAALVDFMLGDTFQSDIPENMFVYPANSTVALPDSFVRFGETATDPLIIDPAMIEANRDDWTERWTDIVLR